MYVLDDIYAIYNNYVLNTFSSRGHEGFASLEVWQKPISANRLYGRGLSDLVLKCVE